MLQLFLYFLLDGLIFINETEKKAMQAPSEMMQSEMMQNGSDLWL